MVEVITATLLTLILMLVVVTISGTVAQSVSDSRATLEMTDRIRAGWSRLQLDLESITVPLYPLAPPRRPEENAGYFEYTEGPIGPNVSPFSIATNVDTGQPDTTYGDADDILMFTIRSQGKPFIGRMVRKRVPQGTPVGQDSLGPYVYDVLTVESYEAEVIYFVRGRTLYRRQLLVLPEFPPIDLDLRRPGFQTLDQLEPRGFYSNDVSIRLDVNASGNPFLAANTLGDLTKPENRYAHRTWHYYSGGVGGVFQTGFPYHPHVLWDWTMNPPRFVRTDWANLGLPTLRECSYTYPDDPTWDWVAGGPLPRAQEPFSGAVAGPPPRLVQLTPSGNFDAWANPHPWNEVEPTTGTLSILPDANAPYERRFLGPRIGEDVILTDVISFDVKAWDPGAPLLRAVDDQGTPADLTDDQLLGNGDVGVVPGDPGYTLALQHLVIELNKPPGTPTDPRFLPIGYGAYVDLNYAGGTIDSAFSGPGHPDSRLDTGAGGIYDTGSFHYEHDGINQDRFGPNGDAITDQGTNGFDDNGNGIVDDPEEMETRPPYPVPLRGIQIEIRCFEPDSRAVRKTTIVQDFLPK